MSDTQQRQRLKRIVLWLTVIVIAMFAFSYALVPLYNLLCDTLGINGKTNKTAVVNKTVVDKRRSITVQFLATNNERLPWTFHPKIKEVILHPGQNILVTYYAKNNTKQTMTVQAVPSVTPGLAASHLKKTECFCFNQQTLKPGQSIDMPIIFHIDNTLPKNIHEITLSYTLFKATKVNKRKTKGRL